MSVKLAPVRDDRVLPYTRGLSLVIVPFLLAAFVILYIFPDHTAELFAWPINPTLTSRVLASAYLGGAYFFLRVLTEQHWHVVRNGFPAVVLFAGLLGVATVLHWDRFTQDHVSFWTWTTLYFVAPFLVLAAWLANQRYAAAPRNDQQRLRPVSLTLIGILGVAGTALGLAMFLAPAAFIPLWPWALTPLTCRVVAAVFCLASAGFGVWRDPRWTSVQRMLEVALIMLSLMLLGTVLGHAELDAGRALFWPWVAGLVLLVVASACGLLVKGVRSRT